MKLTIFGLVTSIQALIITMLEDVAWKVSSNSLLAYAIAMRVLLKMDNIYMINWKKNNIYLGVTNNDTTKN